MNPGQHAGALDRRPGRRFLVLLGLVAMLSALPNLGHVGDPPDWRRGDYAQYMLHARNLSQGKSFQVSEYIYNPARPVGPRSYPPGWPVILAPVYRAFDGAIAPIRVLSLCFFVGCLVLTGLLLRSHLPPGLALAGTALLGMNPRIGELGAGLISDIPFLFFVLCGFFAIERGSEIGTWKSSLVTAGVSFAAYSVRTVGGLLLPAMILAELVRKRRVTSSTVLSSGIFMLLVATQALWTSGHGTYLDQARTSAHVALANAQGYSWAYSALWDYGLDHLWSGELLRKAFTIISLGLIAVGYCRRLLSRPTAIELFVALYVALILFWPVNPELRFLLPLLPPAVLYMLVGTQVLTGSVRSKSLTIVATVVVVAFPLTSYAAFSVFQVPVAQYPVSDAPSRELIAFLRETPDSAVFVAAKPRILSLMTGRRAAANHEPDTDEELLEYLDRIGATHVVLSPPALGGREYLESFLGRNSVSFSLVFANESFSVFAARRDSER